MKMRKCDRCGYITPERIETVISVNQAMERIGELILDAVNALTGKKEKYKLAKINGEEIDLCPNCQKSLKNWMKYGQAIKKVSETIPPDEIKHNGKTYKLEKNEEKPAVEEINIRTNAAGIAEENIPKFGD